MSNRNINLYIADIKDSINRIETYTKDISYEEFCKDGKTFDAVLRNFEVMGEAASNIPEEFKEEHPEILWHKLMAMRNMLGEQNSNSHHLSGSRFAYMLGVEE